MAEEINDPNSNPKGEQESSSSEISTREIRQQADLANQLNNSLNEVNENLEKITGFTRTQSDLFVSLLDSFEKIHDAVEEMANSSSIITENIEKAALSVLDNFSDKNFATINKSLTKVANTAINGITSQTQAFKNLNSQSENFQNTNQTLTQQMSNNAGNLSREQTKNQKEASALGESANKLNKSFDKISEQAKKTSEEIQNLKSGFGGTVKNILSVVTGSLGALFNAMSTLVGAAKNFVAFSLSIPFTITQEAAKLGNTLRSDLVETIQTSVEAAKDKFDLASHVGKAIANMGERGKQMLMDFQDPASEMVKLFGEGAAGIANRNNFMTDSIDSLGQFSEIYGASLANNEKNLVRFTKLTKAFGFSGEDLKYLALDASNRLMHINERMEILGETITSVSKEYGIDRKRLGKNVMVMKKDIISFGHLSDEEITKTAAKITHMKVKLEDAAAVFKKFSTFEDAANSVAMLSQAFGMNLSAMDLIQAQNPTEIFEMFRDSMMQTGRSFEDLNRHEKELMAQHTGMSSESLKALMNYRNLGYSYQEAVDKMNAEKPEAKQMEALKGLNSAIKQIQKVLQFNSPFQAFADGLANNLTLTGSLKDTMVSLSQGYEGIYRYAKELNPRVWKGIVEPIQMILDVMTMIFNSKGFKKGLVGTLKAISDFTARVFGVTNEDVILENLRSNLENILDNKKIDVKSKEKFKSDLGEKMSFALKGYSEKLSGFIPDLDNMVKNNDLLGVIEALQLIRSQSGLPDEIKTVANTLIRNLAQGFSTVSIKTDKGKEEKLYKSISEQFTTDITKNLKNNAENASKLSKLSSNVMGAIIMGAGTGFVAFLRLLNDGIDKATDFMGKGKDKQINIVSKFLHVDKSQLRELGINLNQAIRGLFDRKGKLFSIASWIVGGFSDMFEIIIDVFLSILAGGLEGIFGDMFDYTPSARQMINLSKFDKKAQQEAVPNVIKGLEENKPIAGQDAGALTHIAEAQIRSIKDKDVRASLFENLETERDIFKDSDGGESASQRLAFSTVDMLSKIKDGKYTGKINEKLVDGKKIKFVPDSGDLLKKAKSFANEFSAMIFPPELIDLRKKFGRPDYLGEGQSYLDVFSLEQIPNIFSDYKNAQAIADLSDYFDEKKKREFINHMKSISVGDRLRQDEVADKISDHIRKFGKIKDKDILHNLSTLFKMHVYEIPTANGGPLFSKAKNIVGVNSGMKSSYRGSLQDLVTASKASAKNLNNKIPSTNPASKATAPVTVSPPKSPTAQAPTPTSPLPASPAVTPGIKNNQPKKNQVEAQKQQLQETKSKAKQAKTVEGQKLIMTNEQYVEFSKNLLKYGDFIRLARNPKYAKNMCLTADATIARNGENGTDQNVTPQIQQPSTTMNTNAAGQP